MNKKAIKIGVVLSGCGFQDGAEIHESVLTLLSIQKNGAEYVCFAPDIPQHHVTNHISGENMNETRNVLTESARIARGKISPLNTFDPAKIDALIFPGGFGAALNLSSFATQGTNCSVNEDVAKAIGSMIEQKKPIGALCISPAIMAKVLKGAELTIGQDKGTAKTLEEMGAKHKTTNPGEIVVDPKFKLVTTPCYMLESTIPQIAEGAERVVKTMIDMLN